MGKNTNEEIEIDLIDIFYLIRAKLWVIILSAVILASVTGLVSSFLITPMYTSTAKLYILTKSTSITSLADIQMGTQLTQDYMVLIKSRPVVTQVIENLELDMSYEELVNIIDISNPSNTRILEIQAEYPNALVAKQIVDEFSTVSCSQIAKIMDTEEPSIVEEGYASPNPSSPNVKKNAIIGGLIGAFLAAAVIIVLHLMDDTIKTQEDIEKYLGISTLGLIPIESGAAKQTEANKKRRKKQRTKAKKGKR
jgi:capsular polysaccharide biosynthesis protein